MSRAVWDHLLAQARAAHIANQALSEFCAFPDDVLPQDVTHRHIPPADLMAQQVWSTAHALDAHIAHQVQVYSVLISLKCYYILQLINPYTLLVIQI